MSGASSFTLYFVEMLFAMIVGMMVFVPMRLGLVTLGYAALLHASSVAFEAWMGTFMVAPMLVWMRIRGCNWREAVEMGAGMLLPIAAILFLRAGRLADGMPWLVGSDHPALLLGMLVVMLYRRDRYTSGYALFGSSVVARRRPVLGWLWPAPTLPPCGGTDERPRASGLPDLLCAAGPRNR